MNKFAVSLVHRFWAPPSAAGLLAGALFWLAALTPSLIPRDGLMQGAIAGLAFTVGYALAAGGVALWTWLGLPAARAMLLSRVRWAAALAAALGLSVTHISRLIAAGEAAAREGKGET